MRGVALALQAIGLWTAYVLVPHASGEQGGAPDGAWQLGIVLIGFGVVLSALYEVMARNEWSMVARFEMLPVLAWLPSATALFVLIDTDSPLDRASAVGGCAFVATGFLVGWVLVQAWSSYAAWRGRYEG